MHSAALLEKPRCVVLTKADLLDPTQHAAAAERVGLPQARLISAHSGEGVGPLLEALWALVQPAGAEPAEAPRAGRDPHDG